MDSSGNAEGVRFSKFEITAEASAKWDVATKGALALWLTNPAEGSAEDLFFIQYNNDTDDDMLSFLLNGIYTGPPAHDFGKEEGVFVTLPFKGVIHGATEALVVKQANDIDMTW
jgi:hypothetical protein